MVEQPTGTVTLLFTDIEGSTRLLDRLGPERYREALELHRALLRRSFKRHDGYEVDYEGDAFFIAFARAKDAVAAAAMGQQALASADWPDGQGIRVRIGIHTGEPLAAPPKYVGLDVHKAARIMAAGHGGQVLLSEATTRLLDSAETVGLGEHRLKDLLQAEPLYQLAVAGLPQEFPALKTLGNRPTNLPVQPNPLVGRECEVAEVVALLRDADPRLVTLTGPGGTGKTRLALQVGAELVDDFESGAFFVSLAPIREAALVVPAIAQALAVREVPGEEFAQTLASYLEQKRMLLVLDNFEQVIVAAVEVARLLDRCSRLKLVVTSRERLRLQGERTYAVPPLPLVDSAAEIDAVLANDAVALFVARARAATGDFTLDASDASTVAEICARLDGLPLAIELAAARVPVLPPKALLGRLDQRLPLLTGGPRDQDDRQRTLRAAVGWSYELLDPAERTLFQRLSVFVDGCRFVAVAPVCGDDRDGDLLDRLQALVEKSLLVQRSDSFGEPRFWMLETIREYAAEQLREHNLFESTSQGHADYYLGVAESISSEDLDADSIRLLEADHDNLRSALSWFHDAGQSEAELRLVCALAHFWDIGGHYLEAWARVDAALQTAPPDATLLKARTLAVASDFARVSGRVDLAKQFCTESLALSRQLGDERGVALALHELGEAAVEEEALDEAVALFEEAITVGRAAGLNGAGSVCNLGWVALLRGDHERAAALFLQSLQLFRERRHLSGILAALANLAETKLALDQPAEARSRLVEAFTLLGDMEARGDVVTNLLETAAALLLNADAAEEAARLTGASDALVEAGGFSLHPAEAKRREATRNALNARLGSAAEPLRQEGRDAHLAATDLATKALLATPLT